jgi:putative endonuclease
MARGGVIQPTTIIREKRPPYRRRAALGRSGEAAAGSHLESLGYRILQRRYRTPAGEIDLVAEDDGTLVFVEVKTRSSLGCGRPAEAVDRRKRVRLRRAAALYLLRKREVRPCRFDVVEVFETPQGELLASLIRGAFEEA